MDFWTALQASIAANFAVVIATLLSPLLAVLVTIFYQKRDQQHRLRLLIFTDLMKHRRRRLSPDFVHALNLIPVVFHKNRKVIQALNELSAVIGSNDWSISNGDPRQAAVLERLNQATETKVTVLLGYISQDLRIAIDQLTILQGAYLPRGWVESDTIDSNIKQNLDAILGNRKTFPITAVVYPAPEQKEETTQVAPVAAVASPPVSKRRKKRG